jgi:hypothetical protein
MNMESRRIAFLTFLRQRNVLTLKNVEMLDPCLASSIKSEQNTDGGIANLPFTHHPLVDPPFYFLAFANPPRRLRTEKSGLSCYPFIPSFNALFCVRDPVSGSDNR